MEIFYAKVQEIVDASNPKESLLYLSMAESPFVIGLTGGIGSGKSTVARVFEVFGIPIYNADDAAKRLYQTDEQLKKDVITTFGATSYAGEHVNRSYLAEIVFEDPAMLQKLNAIVHPAVKRDFENWLAAQSSSIVVREAAILFESGSDKGCDLIMTVYAPKTIRIARVMDRDGLTKEQVLARMNHQWSDDERRKHSAVEILNYGDHLLIPQIESQLSLIRQKVAD